MAGHRLRGDGTGDSCFAEPLTGCDVLLRLVLRRFGTVWRSSDPASFSSASVSRVFPLSVIRESRVPIRLTEEPVQFRQLQVCGPRHQSNRSRVPLPRGDRWSSRACLRCRGCDRHVHHPRLAYRVDVPRVEVQRLSVLIEGPLVVAPAPPNRAKVRMRHLVEGSQPKGVVEARLGSLQIADSRQEDVAHFVLGQMT